MFNVVGAKALCRKMKQRGSCESTCEHVKENYGFFLKIILVEVINR